MFFEQFCMLQLLAEGEVIIGNIRRDEMEVNIPR
jgi:hypothetical protein